MHKKDPTGWASITRSTRLSSNQYDLFVLVLYTKQLFREKHSSVSQLLHNLPARLKERPPLTKIDQILHVLSTLAVLLVVLLCKSSSCTRKVHELLLQCTVCILHQKSASGRATCTSLYHFWLLACTMPCVFSTSLCIELVAGTIFELVAGTTLHQFIFCTNLCIPEALGCWSSTFSNLRGYSW